MENRRTTLLALVAIAFTLGVLWYVNRPIIPQEATLAKTCWPKPGPAATA